MSSNGQVSRAGNVLGKESVQSQGQPLKRGWAGLTSSFQKPPTSGRGGITPRHMRKGSQKRGRDGLRSLSGHGSRKHRSLVQILLPPTWVPSSQQSSRLFIKVLRCARLCAVRACHKLHTTVLPCVAHFSHCSHYLSKLISKLGWA